ncbi:hypothetical protein PRZ48_013077 [Zasmidium cellare]|uniref:DUF221-domain-containing protein n=1 Tax=Zasmidium cellare TaxID=395010 RepID=A0ABR0E397_ZASCE|nr:hypothetical protein PRZ48_013077 [Zasmidium cellare]
MGLAPAGLIAARDDTTDAFLEAIKSPFYSQSQSDSAVASLGFSLGLAVLVALLFCFLRPYNNVVYAPRAKYADSKHAPPPVSKGLFGWIPPLLRTKEQDLVERVGLDAAVFMRVCRMLRNIFSIVAILACGIIIPVNILGATGKQNDGLGWFTKIQPIYTVGSKSYWAYVVVSYAIDGIIMFFLWINYRAILKLRRDYFNSQDYQRSLHARTLLVLDVPKELRSDEGLARITDEVKATHDMPRTAIARNVKDLPDLVEEHEKAVRELEEHLAKYLKNPDRLPAKRPTCKPHKSDKSHGTYPKGSRVDAIEYLTGRIKELEIEIREVRETVDKRNALGYGFASYQSIPVAHSVAYDARKKGPHNTIIRLAPKPNDLVWKNLNMTKKQRARQNFINGIWILVLTVFWIIPNLFIACFLSNLDNLAAIWPGFKEEYYKYPTLWAIVQGVLAPALTTAFYFYLPAIFRRLCIKAGDVTKTSRERHVARSLYNFFCFNNLIVFSLFASLFTVISEAVKGDSWEDITILKTLLLGLCRVSTYWITWMLQRNLGAAVDLSQLFTLIWGSFSRRFLSPTPRTLIELSAPQPFDYAGYYNYFLFYSTVAIAFSCIQPLVLAVTAFYYVLDCMSKKYLLLYVFITKYESGGMFWRSVFNRMLFLTLLGNAVTVLVIAAQGQNGNDNWNWTGLAAMVPLPFIVLGFKWYCARTFDDEIHYYQKGQAIGDSENLAGTEEGKKKRKGDRVATRFGHPVLYKPLITPMVASKSQHLLKSIYTGRTSMDHDGATTAGYGDNVYMDNMDNRQPGKSADNTGAAPQNWEIVNENEMDFEHYKDRPEFRDEAGGDGELFGRAGDMIRPGTPSSVTTGFTRTGTFESDYSRYDRSASGSRDPYGRSRSESRDSERKGADVGMVYPAGYHQTPSNLREQSPAGSERGFSRPSHLARQESRDGLMSTAAPPGRSTPVDHLAGTPGGYGPVRYGNIPGDTPGYNSNEEDTSYDYFRRGRTQGR